MISTDIMSTFAESRLGFSKFQKDINIYNSLMHRLVFPSDFPNSALNNAHYPNVITLAKEITGPNDTGVCFFYVDPETAATPRPGNLAITIYIATWITNKAKLATDEDPIPNPLNIYNTGEVWKHISQELQDEQVERIHPNLCRPIYLSIPITEPAW
jgi:hypothetical protein